MKKLLIYVFVSLVCPFVAYSQARENGLALAGGGALGFAHVGVLKVLNEASVPIDYVAGTSMGSIVGAAYAAGASITELEEIISNTDWERLFSDGPSRSDVPLKDKTGRNREILGDVKFGIVKGKLVVPTGILQGQKIRLVLQKLFYRYPESGSFDNLALKYRAIAADIETGLPEVIDRGDLSIATRASMAVPGVFSAVEMNGKLLVDGGIANNLPISVVQEMGAKRIIAVELYADLAKREALNNPLAISGQMLSLLLSQNSAYQRQKLKVGDILIEPDLKGFSATDFNKARELIKRGEDAARAKMSELKKLSISEQEYSVWEAKRTKVNSAYDKIDFVKIKNDSSVPDSVIHERIEVKAGDSINDPAIDSSVGKIYSLGAFSQVSSEVLKQGDLTGIQFLTKEKDWYEQYLRFGLALEGDFKSDNFYNLGAGLRINDVGLHSGYADVGVRLGRVNSLSIEYEDPINFGSNFFYAAQGLLDQRNLYIRNGQDLIAEYERTRAQGGVSLGYGFYESWEALVGYRLGNGDVQRRVGDPSLAETSFKIGDIYTRAIFDTLDDLDFPQNGLLSRFSVSRSAEVVRASRDFTELSGEIVKPINLGSLSFIYRGEFSFTEGVRPTGRSFTLGGFLDLSGFVQNSLVASSYKVHKFVMLQELDSASALLGYKLFGGISLELANLQSDIPNLVDEGSVVASSVFLGANTPILPLYIGYGMAEDGNRAVYLMLGRITSGAQRFEGG